MLRNFASCAGLSAQQVSQDWSDVNYSSARGALLEAWKTLDRRRIDFAIGFAGPVRSAWLEECHEVDKLPMPNGVVPDFAEARGAFGRSMWLGPGVGWMDPVAEKEGAIMGMGAGLSNLELEAAQQRWGPAAAGGSRRAGNGGGGPPGRTGSRTRMPRGTTTTTAA